MWGGAGGRTVSPPHPEGLGGPWISLQGQSLATVYRGRISLWGRRWGLGGGEGGLVIKHEFDFFLGEKKHVLITFFPPVSKTWVSSDKLSGRPQGFAQRTKDSLLKQALCSRRAACSSAFILFTVLLHVAKPVSANEWFYRRK